MNLKKRKVNYLFASIYFFALLFTVYMAITYIINDAANAGIVEPKFQNDNFSISTWKLVFYPHIFLGTVSLLIGPFQLLKSSRKNPTVHRILGRIYAMAIFINVLVVPYLAIFATGGKPSTIAFLVLDGSWLITTAMGIWSILKKDINSHKKWMYRSYGITWVFVTFRFVTPIISLLFHVPNSVSFPAGVYISIFGNLLLVELYLRKKHKAVISKHKVISK